MQLVTALRSPAEGIQEGLGHTPDVKTGGHRSGESIAMQMEP